MNGAHFKQLKAMFEEMDKDNNGVVGFEQFETEIVKLESLNIDKEHIKKMFCDVNVNDIGINIDGGKVGKGQGIGIAYNELFEALIHGYLIDCDERLYGAFLKLDEDMDGKITIDELKCTLKTMDLLGEYDEAMRLIEKQSFGKDGEIDFEEFLLALHPAFKEECDWFANMITLKNMKSSARTDEMKIDLEEEKTQSTHKPKQDTALSLKEREEKERAKEKEKEKEKKGDMILVTRWDNDDDNEQLSGSDEEQQVYQQVKSMDSKGLRKAVARYMQTHS